MNTFYFYFLACAMLLMFGCSKSCQKPSQAQTRIIRIGTSPDMPPFESIDNNGNLVGFDIDVGQALAKKLDKTAEFKQFDFDALILALKNGQIDLILSGLSITPSRQAEIAMVPYQGGNIKNISFLFWQSIPEGITNFNDLAKFTSEHATTVSVQTGHYLQNFLVGEHIATKALAGPPEQILDLKYKKSLAAALDPASAKTYASSHSDLKLLTLDLPQEKWDLGHGIGIKKDRTDLVEEVKKAIESLRADGTLDQLTAKWLNKGEHP